MLITRDIFTIPYQLHRYEAFDFHHECKKMQWHRVSLLIVWHAIVFIWIICIYFIHTPNKDKIAHDVDGFSCFARSSAGKVSFNDNGV